MRLSKKHIYHAISMACTNTSKALGLSELEIPFLMIRNFSSITMVTSCLNNYNLLAIPGKNGKKSTVMLAFKQCDVNINTFEFIGLDEKSSIFVNDIMTLLNSKNKYNINYIDFNKTFSLGGKTNSDVVRSLLCGKDLSYLQNSEPTKIDIECAILVDPKYLTLLKNPTEAMAEYVCGLSWKNMKYVNNLKSMIGVCKKIIDSEPWAVFLLPDKHRYELLKYAASKNGLILSMVKDQTEELCEIAILENPQVFKYVINKTSRLTKLALSMDYHTFVYLDKIESWALEFILSIDPRAILLINKPSRALLERVLRQDGNLLKDIKTKDVDLIHSALKNCGMAIRHVDNPTELMKKIAVTSDPLGAMTFIDDQSYELCLYAAKLNKDSISAINDSNIKLEILNEVIK